MNKTRTRVAPSPTGFLHIGSVQNALFAHALAKSQGGDFILRVEDTDQKRFVEGATQEIYDMLAEFGLTPDEGPEQGGPHAPYVQSERLSSGIYQQAAEKLIEMGHAYYCFLTEAELLELKGGNRVDKQKRERAFRSPYRELSVAEARERVARGDEYVIRLKVPNDETITVEDAILGKITWQTNDVDDQVLMKSDGFPTYQLAVVVDDHMMEISHITRAYEWLSSTPKQYLLYKYLGWELPIFAHSSLVLDPDGGKLSKRKGTVSARQFLEEGYLVEAMINFLILLGWAPSGIERKYGEAEQEFFSHEEFIKLYKLSDRQKHNAIFDRTKLLWFNQQYIQRMPVAELKVKFINWLNKYAQIDAGLKAALIADPELEQKLVLVNTRAKTLVELVESLQFFYARAQNIDWNIKQLEKVPTTQIPELKHAITEFFTSLDEDATTWEHQIWETGMRGIADKFEVKHGDAFMILRLAVCGSPFSPPLFEALQILGKDEVMERLKAGH